jgi:hypothetical protein
MASPSVVILSAHAAFLADAVKKLDATFDEMAPLAMKIIKQVEIGPLTRP